MIKIEKSKLEKNFKEIIKILETRYNIKNAIIRKLENDELITIAYTGYGYAEAHISIRVGEGVTGTCASERRTIVINDLDTYKGKYIKGISCAKSEICIPIKYSGEVIGTFNIESSEKNSFSPDKVDFLERITDNITTSLVTSNETIFRLAKSMAILECISFS
ncbi:MAG: hypothetical protein A2086_10265 [Spirochaetes bacterium GWD1_27_9]|nr:MAG: hypothetical protein A2Y34_16470 [Spirochaetes bacterium GWC1_27_15]OHD43270.1 MAG: hypothetical protein A2086_10265 [Spirochaetes bacterium GWD1_27_9]